MKWTRILLIFIAQISFYNINSLKRNDDETKSRKDYFEKDELNKNIKSTQHKINEKQAKINKIESEIKQSKEDLERISKDLIFKRTSKEYDINELSIQLYMAQIDIYTLKKIEADLNAQLLKYDSLYLAKELQKYNKEQRESESNIISNEFSRRIQLGNYGLKIAEEKNKRSKRGKSSIRM